MHAGFSMIELMIALVLGLLLAEGVFVLFSEANRVSAYQAALARLQETGRVALQIIGDDLRRSGGMPCGSRVRPRVFIDALESHIEGVPTIAGAPPDWPKGEPYALDRGVFIGGHLCRDGACLPAVPEALAVPVAGITAGKQVPGTDVLALRWLDGTGWAVELQGPDQCASDQPLGPISLRKLPGDAIPAIFQTGHAALLASCSAAMVFAVASNGDGVEPVVQDFGIPPCMDIGGQTRLFDLDAQLHTATYFLEMKVRADAAADAVPVLMRRVDGVANEVVEGVERLDFRYSLMADNGLAYWLDADQVARAAAPDGTRLLCKAEDGLAERPCSWADINAVSISMLVNTVVDVPVGTSDRALDYRYSIDGENLQSPKAVMPITGLPGHRLIRREFRSVIALRSLNA